MAQANSDRLLDVYDAFMNAELDRIPEFFASEGCYRASGVFPGIKSVYRGHAEIRDFWHAANEPWEQFEIEICRTLARDERVVAEVRFRGRGLGSGVEVARDVGHLVNFRDGLIVEFSAYGSWDEALAAAGIEASATA